MAEKSNKYDLCIIGCGPSGFAAAMRAFDLEKKVCVIEAETVGGAGVMWGALASKTMWELAKDCAIAAKVDRGYRSSGLMVDYKSVRRTVIQAVKEKQYQMLTQLESFSPKRRQGKGTITLKRGWARFKDPHKVSIDFADGRVEEITADYFLIACGSKPKPFKGIAVDQKQIFNSDGILRLTAFPKRLMIIGAGIIGCEYASIFANFGQTKVHLIDYMERVIPYEDEDISEFVCANLANIGVKIIHSAILRDIVKQNEHLEVILDFKDGHSEVIEADAALIAIGRAPNVSKLNLSAAGVQEQADGYLTVDDNCCVRDHIYAAGDVTRHPALVNIAELEARYAVKRMFGHNANLLNYGNMSTIMFFYPAVAAVGLNEIGCQKQQIAYKAAYYSNVMSNRAIAMRATTGFVKIIVSDDGKQRILGMRAAGPQVSSTVMSLAPFINQENGLEKMLASVYPHPTMAESIQECIRMLLDKSVFKPFAFPETLKIWSWHPKKGFSGNIPGNESPCSTKCSIG